MNETVQNALTKWREENKGVKAVVLDPLEKAKANPKSKVLAIRAFCYDCTGGVKSEVTLCPSTNCPLWLHRPWKKDSVNLSLGSKNSKDAETEDEETLQDSNS